MPSVGVRADVVDDAQNLLLAVEGFQATGISSTSVLVSWQRSTILTQAFRVEMSLDEAGPYAKVKTVGGNICDAQNRCITQIRLTGQAFPANRPVADPTPLFLRVVPLFAVGAPEQQAETMPVLMQGKPSEVDPAILGAHHPINVQCNGGGPLACVNVNSIQLSWTDRSDENSFWIMRGFGATNPQYGTAPYAELPANTTTFNDVISEYGVFYSYRVIAVRQRAVPRLDPPGQVDTELSFSNGQPDVVVESAPMPPPTDPSGLAATFTPPRTVKLTWIDGSAPGFPYVDEDGWFIEQTDGSADFTSEEASMHSKAARVGQGAVAWQTLIPADSLFCYRVRGYRATTTYTAPAYSGYTNTVCMGAPPAGPTNLTANALAADRVKLTWNDRSKNETNFVVQRCPGTCASGASGWSDLTTSVPANTQTYLDTSTSGERTYSYRVFAEGPSGRSAPSNIRAVTTPEAPIAAPTGTLATATGSREITVTWNDVTSAETAFRVEFQNDEGGWEELVVVNANVERYVDPTLRPNQRRCYRVRTLKGSKISDPSNSSCARSFPPAAANGAPTGLTTSVVSNTAIQLNWTDTATNETAFEVEAVSWPFEGCPKDPSALTFRKLFEVNRRDGTGTVSQRANDLIPHTAYVFRVRAINPDGASGYSNLTGCTQTHGPVRPIFIDPEEHGDVEATRCTFTVKEPVTGSPNHGAGGLRVYVNAVVAGSLSHTDTLYVINTGGTVPGATHNPDRGQYIIQPGANLTVDAANETWQIGYRFRRGINYRIIVTAYGLESPYYASAANDVRDVTVVADCPTSGV